MTCTPTEDREFRADALIAALPVQSWRTLSAGKGDRRYAWTLVRRVWVHGINFPDSVYWLLAGVSATLCRANVVARYRR